MQILLTKKKIFSLVCTFCFAFLVIFSTFHKLNPSYALRYNRTNSLPVGLYLQTPFKAAKIQRGVMVGFFLDNNLNTMLRGRPWFPPIGVPLMKEVFGLPGDTILFKKNEIFINGNLFGLRERYDRNNEELPWIYEGPVILKQTQYFVGSHKVRSFDSRYFGPIDKDQMIGIFHPVFTKEKDSAIVLQGR
jgi:conjugative transfer signal peptidase TraF